MKRKDFTATSKNVIKRTLLYSFYRWIISKYYFFYYRVTPSRRVIDRLYYSRFHKGINWDKPQDYNEKINWLKLYSDTSMWTRLADKYAVREYVKSKGLEQILVPLYGCWTKVEDIDFGSLPKQFVLKTNHGWGDVIVVKDKDSVDIKAVKKVLNKNLKHTHGFSTGEPHYKNIPKKIIAEQLLVDDSFNFSSLIDYKIFCFNGKPHFVWACFNRTKDHVYVETHGLDWSFHPECSVFNNQYRDGGGQLPEPKNLAQMLSIAGTLSEGFPQVRVDLYNIKGKVYFGELTFTSDGGYNNFFTPEFLKELGDCCII